MASVLYAMSMPCWPSWGFWASTPPAFHPAFFFFFCLFLGSEIWTPLLTYASLEYCSPSFFCYWTPELPYRLRFSGASGSHDHFGLRPKLQVQLRSTGSHPFVIYGGNGLLFIRLVLLYLLLLPISSSCCWFFFLVEVIILFFIGV